MSRMRHNAIRFAASGMLVAGLLSGCALSNHLARVDRESAAPAKAKPSRAIEMAEATVLQSPRDAAARVALGQTYLEAGRFTSAMTTFDDATKLGDTSGRTQLSLALAEIGVGDCASAVTVLDAARDTIPAADRGLALALAGETGRGVAILTDALRGGENTPKLRLNLAYAFALDGRWREARLAMAQDVPADQMNDRIGSWAMMSQPGDLQKRVASLIGAPVGVRDPGQPERLALGGLPQGAALAAANTTVAPKPVSAELPPLDQAPPAAVAPAPAPVAEAPAPAPAVAPAPATRVMAARVAAAAPAHKRAAPQPIVSGDHLVQVGSFDSEAVARSSWNGIATRNPELRPYRMTITPAVVNGRNFWRVAVGGFDAGSAHHLCSTVRNRGGNCFTYSAASAPAGARPELALANTGPLKPRR